MARWRRAQLVGASQARVLSRATGLIAAVCGVTALVPFSDTAPTGLAALLAVVGLALSAVLRWRAARLTTVHVHGLLVGVTAVMTVCVAGATTPTGAVVTAVSFLWVAVYAAAFQPRRELLAHLVLVGAGLGYGLWSAAPPSVVQTWFFLTATIGGVAWILNDKVTYLRQHATRDPLTGVVTRRTFLDLTRREVDWARRTGEPLTVALLDLDGFKDVNDRHGHAAGDALLAGLPVAWQPSLRPRDVLGRLGGDEFALLMPATTEAEAATVVERMRRASGGCTFSAGLARWDGGDLDVWLAVADRRLYRDKARGRPQDDDVRS